MIKTELKAEKMNEAESKQNITKIKQLLQSENYEAGFELLKTINDPELTVGVLDAIGTIFKERYFKSGEVADFNEVETIIASLNLLKMDLSQMETISMDPVTNGYYNSRISKAVALNTTTSKDILNALIKDDYRWVREAAASNKLVKKEDITDLVQNGDRYILKGLLENPNCTDGIKSEITKKLDDESKYPIETDTYVIELYERGSGETVGHGIDVKDMSDIIIEGGGFELPGWSSWYDNYSNLYHCWGDYTLKNEILLPDGSYEKLDLELKTDIRDAGFDFIITGTQWDSFELSNFEIELEELFDHRKLTVDEDRGLVYGYKYDGEGFLGDCEGGEVIEGAEYQPEAEIIVKIKKDPNSQEYEDFDLYDETSEMEKKGIDVSDAEAVLKYLKEKYSL